MGVKIKDLVLNSKKIIDLTNLTNKIVVIDAFNWIYQFLSVIRDGRGQPLKNKNGITTSHIVGMLPRNISLLEHNIKPIYVFDGKPNPLKKEEINRRYEIKKIAQHNYENAYDSNDDENIKKYARSTSHLNIEMINDFKEILKWMGIPTVQAIEDGESQASYITQKNEAYACASQDYDSFLFGATNIIRNLSIGKYSNFHGHKIKNEIEFYNLNEVLKEMDITKNQLIDIGILVGLDFYKGIKNIGTKTGYKLIKKYKNIETIKKEKFNKYDFSSLTDERLIQIRDIFYNPKITDNYTLKWKQPNKDKLYEILIEKHNFNKNRIEKQLNKICNNKKKQLTLDNLFN